jgi:hypothetical protein
MARAQPDTAAPRPGYWDVTSSLLGLYKKTEQICITPFDVPRLLHGPLRHDWACNYPLNSAADGKVQFDGGCTGPKGQWMKVHGSGVYAPTSLNVKVSGRLHIYGLTLSGPGGTDAHFLAEACPAGARHMKY